MEDSGKVVIRSFRLVFDRGYRRLFKIDRYRLPFAYGLPILGIVYATLVGLALLLAAKLPVPARRSHHSRRRSTGSRFRWACRW